MTEKLFPIIDISYAVENRSNINDERIKIIAEEISDAFGEWGFLYLKGHGISDQLIKKMFDISKDFFTLPTEEKNKVLMDTSISSDIFGYVPFKLETFDANKPFDLKEAFDFLPYVNADIRSRAPPQLMEVFETMYKHCQDLEMLILTLVNAILEIEDKDFLVNAHSKTGKAGNVTVFRSLYYPSVEKKNIEQSQSRCGEHSDYGSLTLLFQDDTGGLEVQSPSGEYISAVPIEGTIVVNAADLLERWTSGRIKSTKHRVVIPENMSKPRQSIAFFCQPDNDFVVECLDGSNKYEPVSSYDYIDSRLQATLGNTN